MRIGLAIKMFFKILFHADTAEQVRELIQGRLAKPEPEKSLPATSSPPATPVRNDAVTLLATLQRESRLIDLVQESLEAYSDAQVGAAARDVLRDCGEVLSRLFDIQPMLDSNEGEQVSTPKDFDPNSYRVIGNASGEPPYTGALVHHGWRAAKCELPQWKGSPAASLVVAPAEIEVK